MAWPWWPWGTATWKPSCAHAWDTSLGSMWWRGWRGPRARERGVTGLDLLLREWGSGTLGPVSLQRLCGLQSPHCHRDGQAPQPTAWAAQVRHRWLPPQFGSTVELLPQDAADAKYHTGSRTSSWQRYLLWITTHTKSLVPSSGPWRLGAPWEHTGVTPCSWALPSTLC